MVCRRIWMVTLALGGCVIDAPPPASPPSGRITREIHQEALHESPPPDIRVVGERFAEAVEDFGIHIRELEASPAPPGDEDLARALELFARAIEATPHNESVAASRTAADMREAARRMRTGPRGSPPVRQAFGEGLRLGVNALLGLAGGPYAQSGDMEARAAELRASLETASLQPPPLDYQRMTEVLRRCVFLMKTILEVQSEPPQ